MTTGRFTRAEWLRRLTRLRAWFLHEAGSARLRAERALAEAARAEGHAAALEVEIRDLSGPRSAT